MTEALIVIPTRLNASRLPNKPLADIGGKPMIIWVAEKATQADVGEVLIAAGDQEIVDVVKRHGYNAVLTDPNLPSGSDRINAAAQAIGAKHNFIINAQGDQPLMQPETLRVIARFLQQRADDFDMVTLANLCPPEDVATPSVAKIVFNQQQRALYFSRAVCPYGPGDHYQHIGLYGFKREILKRYAELPPTLLELRESLEQLRALEAGMRIGVALVDKQPPEVNTPEDLELVRKLIAQA